MVRIVDPTKLEGNVISNDNAHQLNYKAVFPPSTSARLLCNWVSIGVGGTSRKHKHDWEQVNYIISGEGLLFVNDDSSLNVKQGMIIHLPSEVMHWFENTSDADFIILGVLGPDAQ
ncbi:MAG: cupin domain-containing protein [bacterium]|nr:cupin domain-containing protein [bacterium]